MSAWADACLRACVDFLLPALTGSDLLKLLQDRAEGLQLILMYSGRKMVLALIWEARTKDSPIVTAYLRSCINSTFFSNSVDLC